LNAHDPQDLTIALSELVTSDDDAAVLSLVDAEGLVTEFAQSHRLGDEDFVHPDRGRS
jgi:hypothetical protein